MLIDHKEAIASGTAVISAGESLALDLGRYRIPVRFASDAGPSRTEWDGQLSAAVLYNFDNALGVAGALEISGGGAPLLRLNLAVWSLGDPVVARVVHYTAY